VEGQLKQQNRYIPTLDGWRGLSVIGVILYHGGFFKSDSLLAKLSYHGNIGVDVFFALSGFLICGLLLQEYARDGHIDLRRFYIRRVFRILPPYYAALAGIVVIAALGAINITYSNLPSCLLFYRNYKSLATGYYTAHYWSLSLEEHFYLFWPMLLVVVKPKRAGKAAFILAMAVFCWRVLEIRFHFLSGILPAENVMCRTDTRLDGLLWGCLAAIYFPAIKRRVERIHFSQLWLPILVVLLVTQAIHTPSLMLQTMLVPALVLSTVLQPASLLGRLLEWKPLRWIGTISYSLYLWQELFLPHAPRVTAAGAFRHLQQLPWSVLAILVCACLSRYLIEIPMTRLGHRLAERPPVLGTPDRLIPALPK
jgi:peptidoglycan/LPS O-acetylase OafA/YrhL